MLNHTKLSISGMEWKGQITFRSGALQLLIMNSPMETEGLSDPNVGTLRWLSGIIET